MTEAASNRTRADVDGAPGLHEPPLDPFTLPLDGTRLIEASAGTGKTWTIAALYLRLVLGHGTGVPRDPQQILVMTFTQAATRELVERIRARLVAAAARFRSAEAPVPADPFLEGLVDAFAEGTEREQAAWRLANAAQSMDDAAIFTIDAWCQRMLLEHAFDSGCLFDEALEPDEALLRRLAVRDYWRQQVYPLTGVALDAALALWKHVDALDASTRPLAGLSLDASLAQPSLDALLHDGIQRMAALRQAWVPKAQSLDAWFDRQRASADRPFDGRSMKWGPCKEWMNRLAQWAQQGEPVALKLPKAAWSRLSTGGLTQALRSGVRLDLPPVLDELQQLQRSRGGLAPLQARMRLHAAAAIAARVARLKAERGRFGFADLLDRLHAALDPARDAARAARMRERMLAQYPVALVDEFQDTSPTQLAIFEHLHGLGPRGEGDAPGRALLLIGDPKQAIYGFRGADIHSYLRARRATAGRHHRLHVNHRSAVSLVAAVNGLFSAAESRPSGAFGLTDAAGHSELPFVPVRARGRRARFVEAGAQANAEGAIEAPPLVFVLDPEPRHAEDFARAMAARAADRIVHLLDDPATGFEEAGVPFRRLQPGDIAVLVRQRSEAEALRRALRRRGVASVYLSDRDSVFASDEALDLHRLLSAIAAPRELRLARAAAATALMGLSLPGLLRLADRERAFDDFCDGLAELLPVWRSRGVLAMLRQALHRYGLAARWLADADTSEDGERRLTNVLHMAELLQGASARLEGEAALLRWLAVRIDDAQAGRAAPGGEDDSVLRLESDADRVQVVTVHKSKGLEYPVVLLPFASSLKEVKAGPACWVRPPTDRAVGSGASPPAGLPAGLELEPDAQQRKALDEDRLREDLRLLYVALTRARHQLWVGAGALRVGPSPRCMWNRSALGWLLTGPDAVDAAELPARLAAQVAAIPGLQLRTVEPAAPLAGPPPTRLSPRGPLPELMPARDYEARFDTRWSISSYSALVKSAGPSTPSARPSGPAVTLHRPQREDEPVAEADGPGGPDPGGGSRPRPFTAAAGAAPWHRFPRGAFAGNFLHDELEWLAAEDFALATSPALQQALERRCERKGWGHRQADVRDWLSAVCTTPLPSLGVPLSGLDHHLSEMEFWFPSDGLDTAGIDAACRRHLMPGEDRPALPQRRLAGLLMGFADLVFEHAGRHGVLDYKSNALGNDDGHYTPQAMARSMLENRYDVQAALYGLALHRLLRQRLGAGYRPAEHVHGALYCFLRGVAAPGAGVFHLPLPPALLDDLDALLPAVGRLPAAASGASRTTTP